MGLDRAVEVDPAVFPPPVVPQPVGVPHAAAAMVCGGDLFPQKPDVLRMHAQIVGLLPDRPDVLVGIAHDLIEGGIVVERHDFRPLDPVDAQPAGDAGKGLLQPLLQPVGALRFRPLLGDVPDVLDMRGPVPPVDELPAELVDAPVEGVAVLADEDVVPAYSARVAEGAGGPVARDVVAAGLAAVRRQERLPRPPGGVEHPPALDVADKDGDRVVVQDGLELPDLRRRERGFPRHVGSPFRASKNSPARSNSFRTARYNSG